MSKTILVISLLFLISCRSENNSTNYKIVYKNDKDGNTLIGSKEALIQQIRGGADLKIGWGFKGKTHSIEHLSEPIWIGVLDESEVIAHIDPQVLSKTDWEQLSANYADSTLLDKEWRVVITSKGEFDAVWYDRKKNQIFNRRPQNHIITWFAKGSSSNNDPLFSTKAEPKHD